MTAFEKYKKLAVEFRKAERELSSILEQRNTLDRRYSEAAKRVAQLGGDLEYAEFALRQEVANG